MKTLAPAPIGIDLGTYKSKIAVAKRGGVQIITNDANFRQTPCVVGFGAAERNIGEAGFIKMKSNFRDTIIAPQRFIGLTPDYPGLRAETKHCPCKYDLSSGKIQFNVNYQGQKQSIVPEQALAAYLNKLKSIIQHNGFESKQAVIAVPAYMTQVERKGILNAAKIAQLTVTRIINESTAIALDYGIFRKADLDPKVPRNVMFVDFGHGNFNIFCCSFTKQEMNVLYQDFQRNIGCRELDFVMYEFYRNYFQKTSGGLDLAQNRKAIVKLMENIERQRKILTGNVEFDMNIQYLMEENDLHYTMKRQQFNNVCKPIFLKIQDLLIAARQHLKDKGIQIHSVQLVGGGSRIPEFIRIVKQVYGHEPSRTLNSSETVARGCALMAAIKSPLFRVAEYGLNEKAVYGVKFSWNFVEGNHLLGTNSAAYPQKQRKMIFEAGSKIPSSKTIKFARKQAIQILVEYEPPIPGFNKNIAYYLTKPQHPKQQTFGVQFKLKYTEDGLIVFSDCMLIQQWTEQTKIPKKKQAPKPVQKKQGEPETQQAQPSAQQQFQIKKTKKQKATQIKYEANEFNIYSDKQVNDFFSIESTMVNQDRILLETYEKKNQLESMAYNWKEKLKGSHKNYAKPEQIPEILALLEQTSNWLYGEGQQSNRGTYSSKIQNIHLKIFQIQKRYEAYDEITHDSTDLFNAIKANTQLLNSTDKKYEHITPQERQHVFNEIHNVRNWIEGSLKQQQTRPRWEAPVVTSNQIKHKIKDINEKTRILMNKPVPAPPKTDPAGNTSTKMDEEKPSSAGNDSKMDEQKK